MGGGGDGEVGAGRGHGRGQDDGGERAEETTGFLQQAAWRQISSASSSRQRVTPQCQPTTGHGTASKVTGAAPAMVGDGSCWSRPAGRPRSCTGRIRGERVCRPLGGGPLGGISVEVGSPGGGRHVQNPSRKMGGKPYGVRGERPAAQRRMAVDEGIQVSNRRHGGGRARYL